MDILNRFLLNLHCSHRMRKLSLEEKQKRIDKVLQDKELQEILEPVSEIEDDDYFYFDNNEEVEKRIIEKQKEVEKHEKREIILINKNIEETEESIERGRFGRTELHEVVLMGDKNKLKYLLENMGRNYLLAKDNNKHNPFQLALLEEKKELIEIMRPYYEE